MKYFFQLKDQVKKDEFNSYPLFENLINIEKGEISNLSILNIIPGQACYIGTDRFRWIPTISLLQDSGLDFVGQIPISSYRFR